MVHLKMAMTAHTAARKRVRGLRLDWTEGGAWPPMLPMRDSVTCSHWTKSFRSTSM